MNRFLFGALTKSSNETWLMRCSGPLLAAVGLLFCATQRVHAGTIVYSFSGDTTSAQGAYASLSGANFTGSFTIDDSTPATQIASYYSLYHGAITAFDVNVNNITFSLASTLSEYAHTGLPDVDILNNDPLGPGNQEDVFTLGLGSYNYDNQGTYNAALQLNLYDKEPNPTALSTTTLAGLQLNLASFLTSHEVVRWDIHGNTVDYWSGSITSLTPNGASIQTPEPSSLALFGMAAAIGGAYRGWRRRKQG